MSCNWPMVTLGEILTERKEEPSPGSIVCGDVRIIAKIGFNDGKIQFRSGGQTRTKMILIKPGDLVLSGINAAKGAIAVYGEHEKRSIAATIHYGAYIVNKERADVQFLWWLLRSNAFREILVKHLPGGIKMELKAKRLLPISIPLPPLTEQQRIVAKIEQLAAKVEEARKLRQQTSKELETLFISSRAEVMNKPLSHGSVLMEEAAMLERGKFAHRPRNAPRFYGGEHPWIQIGEIESSGKYIRNWTQTLNDAGLSISRKFPKGTLLISIAATIGAVGILDFDCCIPDSIVAITPRSWTDTEFIYHYLGFLRTHLEEVAPQSAQKNINLRILTKLPFPKIDIAEQRRIVAYLDTLQAKINSLKHFQAHTHTELAALLPSILDKAFRGEL